MSSQARDSSEHRAGMVGPVAVAVAVAVAPMILPSEVSGRFCAD